MAVGTQATVKGLTPDDLHEIGVELLFGNTYHLHLRPGEEIVQEFGGLGKFMNWNGPTITDSGGFQVFSLGKKVFLANSSRVVRENFLVRDAKKSFSDQKQKPAGSHSENFANFSQIGDLKEYPLIKIKENGVEFRSHLDGSKHYFTPEVSIQIQKKLGADLLVAFDECAPYPSTEEYSKEAMERTHRWAKRSLIAHKSEILNPKSEINSNPIKSDFKQMLYGVIQGGVFEELRIESAKFISNLDFDGIAIGGVSVGESKKEMRNVLSWVTPFLPEEKPRHLLGIGEIDDIFDAVFFGMDTFDCVIPTRFGRYGILFVSSPEGNMRNKFRLDITRSFFGRDPQSIDHNCMCMVCSKFSRAYIHHLFKANELLAYRLASYHNLYFLVNLVKKIRESILDGRFLEMKKEWLG